MQHNSTILDLFGNERPAPQKAGSAPVQLSAFDHAAERAAIDSGRPVSQERTELIAPGLKVGDRIKVAGAGRFALGHVTREPANGYVLYRCDHNKSERLAPLEKVSPAKAGR